MGFKAAILLLVMAATIAMFPGCGKKTPNLALSGTVIDASSSKPIQGASVSDESYGPEPRKRAMTDSTGKYNYMTWVEEHTIVVKASGYKTRTENLNPRGTEKEKVLDFKLTRE